MATSRTQSCIGNSGHVDSSHERHREKLLTPDEVAVWCSRWSISIKRLGGWPHGNEVMLKKNVKMGKSESLRSKRSKFLLSCFVFSGAFQGEFKHFPGEVKASNYVSKKSPSRLCKSPVFNPLITASCRSQLWKTPMLSHQGLCGLCGWM